MRIEAGILSYKNFVNTTKICLDTLLPQLKNLDINLTVLDNSSPDNSQDKLKEYHNNCRNFSIILNSENLGFAAGFNRIFKGSNADWFLLIVMQHFQMNQ